MGSQVYLVVAREEKDLLKWAKAPYHQYGKCALSSVLFGLFSLCSIVFLATNLLQRWSRVWSEKIILLILFQEGSWVLAERTKLEMLTAGMIPADLTFAGTSNLSNNGGQVILSRNHNLWRCDETCATDLHNLTQTQFLTL